MDRATVKMLTGQATQTCQAREGKTNTGALAYFCHGVGTCEVMMYTLEGRLTLPQNHQAPSLMNTGMKGLLRDADGQGLQVKSCLATGTVHFHPNGTITPASPAALA